jgi:DNA-binding NarL/FixJ family response regulator
MSSRILVVDDHDVVRQGVRLILRSRPEWTVVAEASNGFEAIEQIKSLTPDITILDISMPVKDGLEVLRELRDLGITSKILILTMHDSVELMMRIKISGASGYVIKTNASRDLIPAIDQILEGLTFFPALKPI